MSDYETEVLRDQPLTYYRMNSRRGDVETDLGSLGHEGTYVGKPTYGITGAVKGDPAVRFNPVAGQYLAGVDDPAYSIVHNGHLSVEFWAKIDELPDPAVNNGIIRMVSKTWPSANQAEWVYRLDSTGLVTARVFELTQTAVSIVQFGYPSRSVYHHYVFTVEPIGGGVSVIKGYLDGRLVGQSSFTSAAIGDGTAALQVSGSYNESYYFDGELDEVAIYGTTLSPERVAAHYIAARLYGQVHPVLGCGHYEAMIFERGGRVLVGELPWTQINWQRVLNETSTASVDGVTGHEARAIQGPPISVALDDDFESNLGGWRQNSAVVTRDTAKASSGSASMKIVTNGLVARAGVDRLEIHPPVEPGNLIPVIPGGTYTFSFYAWGDGVHAIRGFLDEFTADLGPNIYSSNTGILVPPAAWTHYSVTRTVGPSTAWVNLRVLTDVAAAMTLWIDRALLTAVTGIAQPQSTCSLLAQIKPWRHELVLYRDGEMVWCGPIVGIKTPSGSYTIQARDLSAWLDKRKIHEDHNMVKRDLADMFTTIVVDAMKPDQSPGLTVETSESGVLATRKVLAAQNQLAGPYVRDLTAIGIDWTVIGREMRAGGLVVPANPLFPFVDAHFVIPPTPTRDGTQQVNSTTARGAGGGEQGDTIYYTATDEEARIADGLLEGVLSDSTIEDYNSIRQYARSHQDLVTTPEMIEQSILVESAPHPIEELVPGALCPIMLEEACLPVNANFRLQSVAIAATSGGGEQVTPTFQPEGTTEES